MNYKTRLSLRGHINSRLYAHEKKTYDVSTTYIKPLQNNVLRKLKFTWPGVLVLYLLSSFWSNLSSIFRVTFPKTQKRIRQQQPAREGFIMSAASTTEMPPGSMAQCPTTVPVSFLSWNREQSGNKAPLSVFFFFRITKMSLLLVTKLLLLIYTVSALKFYTRFNIS